MTSASGGVEKGRACEHTFSQLDWYCHAKLLFEGFVVTLSTAGTLLKVKAVKPKAKRDEYVFATVFDESGIKQAGFSMRLGMEMVIHTIVYALCGEDSFRSQFESDGSGLKLWIVQRFFEVECTYCLALARIGARKQKIRRVPTVLSYLLRTECNLLALPIEIKSMVRDFVVVPFVSKILSVEEIDNLKEKAFEKCGVDFDTSTHKLLFRATDEDFRASEFHKRCHRKGATLTVALTEFGHVIGGFTTVPWATKRRHKRDSDAWLFVARVNESKKEEYSGVRLPAILRANARSGMQVCHYLECGPVFGFDLRLSDVCHTSDRSYCKCTGTSSFINLCDGVSLKPLAITGGSTLDYIGESHFRVAEYEVFRL